MDVRKSNVRVPSAQFHEDALDLVKALKDETDVSLEGVWRYTRERDGRCRGRLAPMRTAVGQR